MNVRTELGSDPGTRLLQPTAGVKWGQFLWGKRLGEEERSAQQNISLV